MTTLQSIRDDLKTIRNFYVYQQVFNNPNVCVSKIILEKIKKFHDAASLAPPQLFAVYIELYVNNNTQQALAIDWGYSEGYVGRLIKRLCNYLVDFFNAD